MAISEKYGKLDIPKIGDDEPVFILRAQDQLAEGIIEIYRVLAVSHQPSLKKSLDEVVTRFRDWKGQKKIPD
jgi:hypothetical protein